MATNKHQTKNRNLSLQALEDRNMFAGNMLASLVGTHLSIGGDPLDNQVEIAEIAPNTIRVTGLGATTINGAALQVFAASLIEDVSVQTGEGNDQVIIRNLSLTDTANGNLKVFSNSGDDQILMNKVTTSERIELDTGDHNDLIRAVKSGTDGQWTTNSGNGHDRLAMHTVAAKDMVVDMMDGDDRLKIWNAKIRNDLSINTHTENDSVRIEKVVAGNNVLVRTDQGMDRVQMRGVSAGNDVGVDTGSESDSAFLNRVKARHDVIVRTGNGDDLLVMNQIKAVNHIDVDTGLGDDRAYIMRAKAHDVYVQTGDGADNLYMSDVNTAGDLFAALGAGDDVFRISNSNAVNPFFDGGLDFDTIVDLPNAFDEVLASFNFELVL